MNKLVLGFYGESINHKTIYEIRYHFNVCSLLQVIGFSEILPPISIYYTAPYLLWAYGVVVSMFDFHCSDRGSNPGRGGKISYCLRLHYRAAPLASV